MQSPVISVRGEAYLEAEPEIAGVTILVEARGRDRRTVLDLLVSRNKEVLDLVRGYGDAVEKIESGSVSAHPDLREKSRGEKVNRYVGRTGVEVTVNDFAVLGELVTKAADLELVSVTGPRWALRPDSPVRREARIAAARDATVRAGEYAEAFGGLLGGLIEASDVGLLTTQAASASRTMGNWMSQAAGPGGGTDGVASLDLEPVRQPVTAQVEARFTVIMPGTA